MSAEQLLTGGFQDPAIESARAFRQILEALARPGRIETVEDLAPPAPLSPAAAAVALTLFGPETGIYLAGAHDTPELRAWLAFQTGAPIVAPEAAAFAIGTWVALQPVSRFAVGEPEYPDRSVTFIVEEEALLAEGMRLTGPGIASEAFLRLPEIGAFQANRARFPLGFDCFFTAGVRLAGLPRSTKVEAC